MTCYSVTIYGNKTIDLFWLTLHLPASVDFMIKSKLNSFILLCLFVLSQPVLIQSGSFIIPCGTDKNKRWLKKCLCLSLYRIIPLWKCSTEFSYPWFLNFLFVLVKCIFIKVSKLKISSVNVANRSYVMTGQSKQPDYQFRLNIMLEKLPYQRPHPVKSKCQYYSCKSFWSVWCCAEILYGKLQQVCLVERKCS